MLISVIMCVFNESEDYINQAIESILSQTFTDFEFIIIDDNPENFNIKKTVKSFNDPRIRYYQNTNNIGLPLSLNRAIELSKGKFIARMDADDISMADRLSVQLKFMNDNPDVWLCGTNIILIDEFGLLIPKEKKVESDFRKILLGIRFSNMLHHPSWFLRKEIFQEIGLYMNLPSSQDYEFLLRCASRNYKFTNIDKRLLKYRVRRNSISGGKKFQQNSIVHLVQKTYGCLTFGNLITDGNISVDLIKLKKDELVHNALSNSNKGNILSKTKLILRFPLFYLRNFLNKFLYRIFVGGRYG